MKDLQSMARKSLKGETHNKYIYIYIYTELSFNLFDNIQNMESYQKRKRLLEERHGKLIQGNVFND